MTTPPLTPPPDTVKWAATVERDPRLDGAFVYAVRTTGIYCRPSCAARTPLRENVFFFTTPAEAEAGGFRACQRCRPNHPLGTPTEEAVARARAYLDESLAETPDRAVSLAELARVAERSASHLQRLFKRIVGLSPKAYADAKRLEAAKASLREGETVLGATFEAGYGSARALYDRASQGLGMTPGAYRRGGAGEDIRYALFDTALGVVLVAATDVGVCAVTIDDDAGTLEEELRAEFSQAEIIRDEEEVGAWAEPVLRYLAGAPGDPSPAAAETLRTLPLDLRGTEFQRRVWAALREIPPGETRTYGEVAAALGHPSAARAVARACGANRIALVVPCHRVIGADGSLRGYRWGPARKRRLLDHEAAAQGSTD